MMETKSRKFNKMMGLNFILASLAFYFLPDFITIDILPDIIGYALAAYGLTMLGDICEDLAEARRRFMKMMIIGAARIFALFATFTLFGGNERPTAILTAVFVLGVVECVFLVPAVKSMFDGLLYLGTRHNGTAVFKRPSKPEAPTGGSNKPRRVRSDRHSYTDTLKRQTVFFIIWKNVLSVLPELLSLSSGGDFQYYNYQRYDQVNYFRVMSMIAVAIVGIVWLVRAVKYFKAVMADAPFMQSIAEKYRVEVLPNESIFFRRRAGLAFIAMSIGAFTAVDFYIDGNDGINIIPDIIFAICILAGILIISTKKNKWRMPAIAVTSAYGILSSLTWKFNFDFTYAYTARDVSRDIVANRLWKLLTAVSVLEGICFAAVVMLVGLVLRETIADHTGYFPKHATIDPTARAEQLHKKLNLMLKVSVYLAALAGAGGVLRVWMFCSESFIADLSWIIEVVLTAAYAAWFTYSVASIKESVEEKYMLS